MAIDSLTGGAFQDPGGNPVALGSVSFQLSTPAVVSGTGQVVENTTIVYKLDANGNIVLSAPVPNLWGNDQLQPAGTFYIVNIFNAQGAVVRGPENWVLQGTSPISLTAITPATPAVSYSGAVLTNPPGDQTIASGNLTVNNNLTVNGNFSAVLLSTLGNAAVQNANIVNANLLTASIPNLYSTVAVMTSANITSSNIGTANINTANVGNLSVTGKLTAYNGLIPAGPQGFGIIVASNLSANLQANFNGGVPKTLYQTVASEMFALTAFQSVINTPTSGNGPNLVLNYTDAGSVPRSVTLWSAMLSVSSNANFLSNIVPMYCAPNTSINVTSQGYTAGSGGALAYSLGLTLEAL